MNALIVGQREVFDSVNRFTEWRTDIPPGSAGGTPAAVGVPPTEPSVRNLNKHGEVPVRSICRARRAAVRPGRSRSLFQLNCSGLVSMLLDIFLFQAQGFRRVQHQHFHPHVRRRFPAGQF